MFEPRVKVFEVDRFDKWLRGTPFAYIDIVNEMGVMHLSAFDSHDIKLKLKTILTNRDFTYKNSQVAVIFARSKSDIKDIRKAVKEVYEQICESFPPELIELYERAHEEGFFVDLEKVPVSNIISLARRFGGLFLGHDTICLWIKS